MSWRAVAVVVLSTLLAAGGLPANAAENPAARAEARQRVADAMFADLHQATWVRDGKSAHVIYVFFDPNCPFCHKVYETLRPQVERGAVELRWIPIGTLMVTSPGKAATILEASNPTEALYKNERGFSRDTGSFGGIEEEPVPRDDTVRRLEANLKLLRKSGNDAVPLLLFRTRDGRADFILGAPPVAFFDQLLPALE